MKNKEQRKLVFNKTVYLPLNGGQELASLGLNDGGNPCDPAIINVLSEAATISGPSDPSQYSDSADSSQYPRTDQMGFGLGGGKGVAKAFEEFMQTCLRNMDDVGELAEVAKKYKKAAQEEAKRVKQKAQRLREMEAEQAKKISDDLDGLDPKDWPLDIKKHYDEYKNALEQRNIEMGVSGRVQFFNYETAKEIAIRNSMEHGDGGQMAAIKEMAAEQARQANAARKLVESIDSL